MLQVANIYVFMRIKLFVFISVLLSFSAHAQWTNDSLRNTIVKDTAAMRGASDPQVVATTGGKSYIAWAEMGPDGGFTYRMQLLDSNGYRLWPSNGVLIDSMAGNTTYMYDLKTDKDGNAVIGVQNIRSGNPSPIICKVNEQGQMMWGASGIPLTDTAQDGGIFPNICVTDNNNVVVAWSANKGNTGFISALKITPNGAFLWADNLRIMDSTNPSTPSIIASTGEDFIIQYSRSADTVMNFSTLLYAQRYDHLGRAVWSTATKISTKTIQRFHPPGTMSDGYGGIITHFISSNPDNINMTDVYAQRIYADGHVWDTIGKRLSSGIHANRFEAGSLFVASQNQYFTSIYETDPGQNKMGIALQKLDTAGNVLLGTTAPLLYPLTANFIYSRSITDMGDGILIPYSLGDAAQTSLYVIKATYNGSAAWQPASVPLSVATGLKNNCVLSRYSYGQVVAVWCDDRMNRGGGIYAQNIRKDGSRGMFSTSVQNNKLPNQLIKIFPNPAQQQITITFKNSNARGIVSLKLINLAGQIVLSDKQNLTNTAFDKIYDLSTYPRGTYLLEVNSGKTVERVKIVLQ